MGFETIMFTVSVDSIALMPCNPNIGGSSKGHLVRELDALGGEMGKNIDKTFIQSKMLNESKGPAVHSLRAQADKQDYTASMRQVLENTEHLTIRQAEVTELLTEPVEPDAELLSEPAKLPSESMKLPSELAEPSSESAGSGKSKLRRVTGVKTISGAVYHGKAVVLATGVYLRARLYVRRRGAADGPQWPAGSKSSDGFLKGKWDRNVPV